MTRPTGNTAVRFRRRGAWTVAVALAFGAGVGLTGCGDDAPVENQGQPIDKAAILKKMREKKKAEEVEEQQEAYAYSPVGKRDPFRSYLAELQKTEDTTERTKEPTEEYELDQYRLTGLVTGTSQPKAMVEDPSGEGHILRVGSRLGRNGGRVKRISSTTVIVVEEYRDPKGELVRVPITIALPVDANALTIRR